MDLSCTETQSCETWAPHSVVTWTMFIWRMLLVNITQKRTPKPFSQETKQKDPVRKIILKWNKNDRALADIVFSVFLNFHQYLSIHLRMLPSVLKPRHSFLHSFKGKESCLQCSSEEELAMRHPPQILFRSSPSGLCTRGYCRELWQGPGGSKQSSSQFLLGLPGFKP